MTQVFSFEFWKFLRASLHRTPLVAASAYTQIKLWKKEAVSGWIPFLVVGPYIFCTPHPIHLNIGFFKAVLHGNNALSFVAFWAKNWYSRFLRKVLVFQKTSFKVGVLKTLKIPNDFNMKICRSFKRRAIFKISSTVF